LAAHCGHDQNTCWNKKKRDNGELQELPFSMFAPLPPVQELRAKPRFLPQLATQYGKIASIQAFTSFHTTFGVFDTGAESLVVSGLAANLP
jgi:hypothetical protein